MSEPQVSSPRLDDAVDSIVHAITPIGHRRSYVDTIAAMLGYAPLFSSLNVGTLRALLRADKLILATFDDSPAVYATVALLRGLRRRRTVGLFLRPQTCLRTDHLKFWLKKSAYRCMRRVPGLMLVTITPHDWQPQYRYVSNVGTYDPQYWDFHDGNGLRAPCQSGLARDLAHISGSRTIICLPGFVSLEKGFKFFAELAARKEIASAQILLVAAGRVLPEMRKAAEAFTRAGGLVIDRELSNDELESLYVVSDAIWACYEPSYDQASGIFGRAIQSGTPVFVRQGSMIEDVAHKLSTHVIALPYGDVPQATAAIVEWAGGLTCGKRGRADHNAIATKVGALRQHFEKTLVAAL